MCENIYNDATYFLLYLLAAMGKFARWVHLLDKSRVGSIYEQGIFLNNQDRVLYLWSYCIRFYKKFFGILGSSISRKLD